MSILSSEQRRRTRQFILQNGRLLERQLFEYFFGQGSKQACIQALRAYQNADGGFGNGLEPDLLCPDSTAIGAETAMYVMDILEHREQTMVDLLLNWFAGSQDADGTIPHPPAGMFNYPFQPWWKNPDPDRVLVLAGLLKKWEVPHDPFLQRVRGYYEQAEMPAPDNFYGYPHFVYLTYCGGNATDRARLTAMIDQLPVLLEQHADHVPLFSRYWYHAAACLSEEAVTVEAKKFARALQEDGGLALPYPDLPWWRPIWTLDGLIQLRRLGLL